MAAIQLRIFGQPVEAKSPDGPSRIRYDEALPFFYDLDDQVIGLAVDHGGAEVSCRKGCSMCCRAQPAPVTPPEAYALSRVVEAMPEPRRSEVLGRFAENVARLDAAGLTSHFLERDPDLTAERAREIAREYFNLGLVCPFLENDACGIYAHRPFVCRQYLVTSDPALCSDPFQNQVAVVKIPIGPAGAVLRATSAAMGARQYSLPLALALEYVARHRGDLERKFRAKDVYAGLLQETFGRA